MIFISGGRAASVSDTLWSVERFRLANSGLSSPEDSPDPSLACSSFCSTSLYVIFWFVLKKILAFSRNPSWRSSRGVAPDDILLSGMTVMISGELASTTTEGIGMVIDMEDADNMTGTLFRSGTAVLEPERCVPVMTSTVCPLCLAVSSGFVSSETMMDSV